MKGLELCHRYFNAYGEQMINKDFYSYRNRIAAGMAGEGSECLGFDDETSRDHDWGPGFCLWLDDDDFDKIGVQLQKAYEKLPDVFMGFRRLPTNMGSKRVGVLKTSDFYRWFTGLPHAPQGNAQWINLLDEYLCTCTNGKVFRDPLGRFSSIRDKLLEFYPEDVRKFRISGKCISCAQSGQYNFARCIKRKEFFAASYAQNIFCSDAISLVFLLNKKFSPFYKWKHRSVKMLGVLGKQVYDAIFLLVSEVDGRKRVDLMENISTWIIEELKKQGLSDSKSDFLLDHGMAVQKGIQDKILRERDAWGG